MQVARVVGTVFLAMTLVFGTVLAFIPTGEAGYEKDGTRTTETYSFFGKVRENSPAGEPADGVGGTSYSWSDSALDGTGGITYLRWAGPLLIVGLLFTIGGLVLTVVPRTSPSVLGGAIALPGAAFILLAVTLAFLGPYMHGNDQLVSRIQVDWRSLAGVLAVLSIGLSTVASGMGLVRSSGSSEAMAAGWDHPTGQAWVAGRNLRCPDCSTVVTAGYGVVPICPTCNFGADYAGPAAPPVPVRSFTTD